VTTAPLSAELRRRGIDCLYHYSPLENLGSLMQHGILSRRARQAAGVHPAVQHGWGTRAQGEAWANYVCLGFAPPRVMMGKEKGRLAVITVTVEVVDGDGVVFAPGNSARADLPPEELQQYCGAEALGLLFADDDGDRRRNAQSEILVPQRVPPALFGTVMVRHPDGTPDRLRTLWWRLQLRFRRKQGE
jgi:hypothetical protein